MQSKGKHVPEGLHASIGRLVSKVKWGIERPGLEGRAVPTACLALLTAAGGVRKFAAAHTAARYVLH